MEVPAHHLKQSICTTRTPYREGRHPKAVKVYTVNNESIYLIIQGVPSVGSMEELKNLCSSFGPLEDFKPLDEYPCEDKYTEVYMVKYKRIQSSRFAKRKLDEHSFFGGNLHVFYAPEYESLQETRDKLRDRRQVVAKKIKHHTSQTDKSQQQRQPDGKNLQLIVSSMNSSASLPTENRLPSQHTDHQHLSLNQHGVENFLTCSSSTTKPNTESLVSQYGASKESSLSLMEINCPEFMSESQPSEPNIFELPLPPQPSKNSQPIFKNRNWRHYEYSLVPTAHANLPEGYDGRLSLPKLSPALASKTVRDKDSVPSFQPSQIVVKDYKPQRPAPKFVPRQAVKTVEKAASSDQISLDGSKISPHNVLDNDDLRQNAFRLGKKQGPEEMPGRKRPLPTTAQQSVNNTILSIRSKISKVIGEKVGKKS